MLSLTRVQKQILQQVIAQGGLPVRSLYQLTIDLGIDYSWAWASLHALERAGLIRIDKPGGRDLFISMVSRNNSWFFFGALSGGTVSAKSKSTEHRTQHGGFMVDPIASLRASLPEETPYTRPELTAEESDKYSKVAARLNKIRDERMRLVYVAAMIYENVRLVKEINEHRAARGMELLPVYDPEAKKK